MAVRTKRGVHDTIAVLENGVQFDPLLRVRVPQSRRGIPTGGDDKTAVRAELRAPHSVTVRHGGKQLAPRGPGPKPRPPVETRRHGPPPRPAARGMVHTTVMLKGRG